MNVFEKRIAMLKKNEKIFKKYYRNEEMRIIICNDKKENFQKRGYELLEIEVKSRFEKVRSIYYYNIVNKRLHDYSFPEWIVCIEEKVLLEYAIPIFSRVLKYYPMLCGEHCEWEVLYEISKVDENFWNMHKEWKLFFKDIINNISYNNEKEINDISKKYIHQFHVFIST